jgi:hypothetical protein
MQKTPLHEIDIKLRLDDSELLRFQKVIDNIGKFVWKRKDVPYSLVRKLLSSLSKASGMLDEPEQKFQPDWDKCKALAMQGYNYFTGKGYIFKGKFKPQSNPISFLPPFSVPPKAKNSIPQSDTIDFKVVTLYDLLYKCLIKFSYWDHYQKEIQLTEITRFFRKQIMVHSDMFTKTHRKNIRKTYVLGAMSMYLTLLVRKNTSSLDKRTVHDLFQEARTALETKKKGNAKKASKKEQKGPKKTP